MQTVFGTTSSKNFLRFSEAEGAQVVSDLKDENDFWRSKGGYSNEIEGYEDE